MPGIENRTVATSYITTAWRSPDWHATRKMLEGMFAMTIDAEEYQDIIFLHRIATQHYLDQVSAGGTT